MPSPLFVHGTWVQPGTEAYKEYSKWEQDGRDGRPLYKPSEHPYPKMLFRAKKRRDGRYDVAERDMGTADCMNIISAFAQQCQKTVGVHFETDKGLYGFEEALRRAKQDEALAIGAGWFETPKEAIEHGINVDEQALAQGEAHRHYEDRHMSEAAKAEANAFSESPEFVPAIPEKPKAKRGRPRKVVQAEN